MASVVRMPGVSADASESILVEWSVAAGDSVSRGDILATVETEKAVVEIEADRDGVLLRTLADAGEQVAIGGPIAVLIHDGEKATDQEGILAQLGLGPQAAGPLLPVDEERSQDTLALGETPPIVHTADQRVSERENGHASIGRLRATPLVRRLAAEAGFSLDGVTGSGPSGRIRRRDLEAAIGMPPAADAAAPALVTAPIAPPLASPKPAAPSSTSVAAGSPAPVAVDGAAGSGYTDVPASKFRRAVAAALTASKQNVPHFYLKATCRVDELLRLRAEINAGGATSVTINDFVVKAAAIALQRVPEMNVSWTGEAVRSYHSVDVAVAMATERGLVVPVLRSVETTSLGSLSACIKELAGRAAANSLKQRELEGGALAVSNLGMFGVEEFTAIINPPQAGILAVGAVTPQAVEGPDGGLELARCLKVVLSVDHRPVDGALAARWLAQFRALIENPLQIIV